MRTPGPLEAHTPTSISGTTEPMPAEELIRMMEVRRVALDQFGEEAIKEGMPLATMEEALVPLFLHHRYQAEATSKVVGGLYYTYAMQRRRPGAPAARSRRRTMGRRGGPDPDPGPS